MKRVLICPNPDRDTRLETAGRIQKLLDGKAETTVCPIYYTSARAEGRKQDWAVRLDKELKNTDFVVPIGGDGTIMHTARAAAPYEKPVIGVNKGNKGFLAELDEDSLDFLLKVVDGDCTVESRMMLDVAIMRDGKSVYSDFAINDAAISGISRVLNISVYADGIKMSQYAGDGVVISSPTGSTAYSMSAGGPIVEPGARNIIVTPICAHALVAKPFVLLPDREVTAEVNNPESVSAFLSVDGDTGLKLRSGDLVRVKRSEYVAGFIKVTGKSFYETVTEKLGG